VIFLDSITRMRRMLRDPNGIIWTDDDITSYFNESQIEIAQKTQTMEKVATFQYPPLYTWGYMNDWEYQHCSGDRFQSLTIDQNTGAVICYPWEPGYWIDNSPTSDEGIRSTLPFEVLCSSSMTPAEPIEMLLDSAFLRMSYSAFDKWPITPLTMREVINNDRFYKTRVGSRVLWYYRPDEYGYKIIPYPRPASVNWQDTSNTSGMSDTAGIIADPTVLYSQDVGLPISVVQLTGALFTIYDAMPYPVESVQDTLYWPDWFVKYVEYGALERAFAADTDGYIPSLRDYWQKRKDLGIEVLKRLKRMRMFDQEYRMGGPPKIPHSKGGSLPSGYPPVPK
jgi:hypothetical protein